MKRFKRPANGMLRVKNVDPIEMRDLLARTETVKKDRYVRSIRKDLRRWLKVYCPVILPSNRTTMKVVTQLQDCVA